MYKITIETYNNKDFTSYEWRKNKKEAEELTRALLKLKHITKCTIERITPCTKD